MRRALVWLWHLWVFGGTAVLALVQDPKNAFVWLIVWCGIAHMLLMVRGLVKGRMRPGRPGAGQPGDRADGDGFRQFDEREWPRRSGEAAGSASAREAVLQAQLQASHRQIDELRGLNETLKSGVWTLMNSTQRHVAELEARNAKLEGELRAATSGDPLFRRVGLDAACPDWVATAVRREYRKRFHPDLHSGANKDKAEKAFKEAEGVFDQIWTRRGFN